MKIAIDRVLEKLDEYFSKNDMQGANRHLKYWVEEAKAVGDKAALFAVYNEQIGFYRKAEQEEDTMSCCLNAEALLQELGLENTLGGATTYVNIATAYKAFGKAAVGLPYFQKAQKVYETYLEPQDKRLAALYNNMALALTDTAAYKEAERYYQKAISIQHALPDGLPEEAISYLNLADLKEREQEATRQPDDAALLDCVQKAKACLENPSISQNGYYAYVCEKCAPTFRYYGFFRYATELEERAKQLYAGT